MKKILGIVVLGLLWCNVSFSMSLDYENEIKDKNEFEQSLGAGFWDLFTIILFLVLIIIVAAFAADYLQ